MKYNSNDNKLYLHNHIFAKIIAKVNLILKLFLSYIADDLFCKSK